MPGLLVQRIRDQPDVNADGDRRPLHEHVGGPVNAGQSMPPAALDPTLEPTSRYAEGNLLNVGAIRLEPRPDGTAHLIAEVRGEDGEVRPGCRIDLASQ